MRKCKRMKTSVPSANETPVKETRKAIIVATIQATGAIAVAIIGKLLK